MEYIEETMHKYDADVYVCPELFNTGYMLDKVSDRAVNSAELKQWASGLAEKSGKVFIPGSFAIRGDHGIANTMSVFDEHGREKAAYEKTHLFTLTGEDEYFYSGTGPVCAEVHHILTGFAVCYDMRFPELFIKYRKMDVQLMILPANWPMQRIDHWITLGRARALENAVFIAGINRTGKEDGIVFGGSSFCFGPGGEELLVMGSEAGFDMVEIDTGRIDAQRRLMDSFKDRRIDIY